MLTTSEPMRWRRGASLIESSPLSRGSQRGIHHALAARWQIQLVHDGTAGMASGPAAVRAGDDLQPVAVMALPVEAAAAVLVVDLPGLPLVRVRPPLAPLLLEPVPNGVEVVLADKEGVVLGFDLAGVLDEVEVGAVVELEYRERAIR